MADNQTEKNMNKTKIQTVKNPYGHQVRQWCGSCKHRLIEDDGSRICGLMQIKVKRDFVCSHWLMNDAVRVAGLWNGGVVKLRGTKETIIN